MSDGTKWRRKSWGKRVGQMRVMLLYKELRHDGTLVTLSGRPQVTEESSSSGTVISVCMHAYVYYKDINQSSELYLAEG